MGAVTASYRAASNLTITGLDSLASSQTWVAGWTSGTIDNTTNLDLDIGVMVKLTIAAANNQAGELRVYAYTMLDDTNWALNASAGTPGTVGALTILDTEQRDSELVLLWSTAVDTGVSEVHYMPLTSIARAFGYLPAKFALFITINPTTTTTAGLAASGNQVTVKGYTESVA